MARTAGAPGSWVTTWSVQIFSTMVRGAAALIGRAYQRCPGTAGATRTTKERPFGRSMSDASGSEATRQDSIPAQAGQGAGSQRRVALFLQAERQARGPSVPLQASGQREGHGRQERHGHGEARQVRLHDTTSIGCVSGRWLPATGRSSREDPWLCVPVSRRVCPGRLSNGSERRFSSNGAAGRAWLTCIGSTGRAAARVIARTHHPAAGAVVRRARLHRRVPFGRSSAPGRASRRRSRWRHRRRSGRRPR